MAHYDTSVFYFNIKILYVQSVDVQVSDGCWCAVCPQIEHSQPGIILRGAERSCIFVRRRERRRENGKKTRTT